MQQDIAEIGVQTFRPQPDTQIGDQGFHGPGRGLGPDHPPEFLLDLGLPPLDIGLALGRAALGRLGPACRRFGRLAIGQGPKILLDLFLERQDLAHGLGSAGEIQLKMLGDPIADAGRIGGGTAFALVLLHDLPLRHDRGRHGDLGQLIQHRQPPLAKPFTLSSIQRCMVVHWHGVALGLAGAIGSGVAVFHGELTQRLMVGPFDKIAERQLARTIRRLVPMLLHFSTFNWFLGGVALIAAALWFGPEARLAISLQVGSSYFYGALGNLWATRGRHPGWLLYAVALVLIAYGASRAES